VRITIDWTTGDDQHLLIISLVIGRRAVPIYWRIYARRLEMVKPHKQGWSEKSIAALLPTTPKDQQMVTPL
jgi:hypothetical protein